MSTTPIEDFTLASTSGQDFNLSAAAKPLVIYFYPKDSTPGCTT
ncbi:MAG: redoxin domain-containing protein, partial [Methyloversatilis sp.]|nr:redoxin domain-containing protein [Methyloversatilis sp.]